MRRLPGKVAWAVPALGLLLVVWASPVDAHAWLLEGHPGPNEHATEPPKVLFLRFTENVEREHTGGQVFDLNRTRWDADTVQFPEGQRDSILVPLKPLPDGIYTVRWFTLSVDTHTASGTYVFAVGNATLTGADSGTGHEGHGHQEGAAFWGEAAARAVYYVGLLAAVGIPLSFLVLAPRRIHLPPRFLLGLASAAAALSAVGALVLIAAFANRLDLPWMTTATGTRTGRFLALRLAAVLLAFVSFGLAMARTTHARVRPRLLAGGLFGLVGLAATTASSHAASVASNVGVSIAVDLAHLLAGSFWFGGLTTLWVLSRGSASGDAGRLVTRFSPFAMAAVALLILTGVYASLQHLNGWSGLWTSTYGRAVLVKASLLIPLVSLGAYNKYRLGPRLDQGRSQPVRLARTVSVEAAIIVVVLAAAGVLATAAPPSGEPFGPGGPRPLVFEKSLKTSHLVLDVLPNPPTVGLQNFTVYLHPFGTGGIPNGTQVFLKIAAPGQPEPESILVMERDGENRWTLSGGYFTERGVWTVYVVMQRPDEYAKTPFQVTVQ